ncbi:MULTISPECIES: phage protein NinX family protein [Pseudomonas]|uniref:phage protein NinX family protein n=1 Tax=Pseudomonas TaxID=286 RepID=UPI001481EFC9|nr:phage protein NinX family protein [Pseudomonas fluorescens]
MTEFVEVKTQELSGVALDWSVAQVEIKAGEITDKSEEHSTGRPYFNCKFANPSLWGEGREQKGTINQDTGGPWVFHGPGGSYSPSTDWGHGGPLIARYQVALIPEAHDGLEGTEMSERWYADVYFDGGNQYTTEHCDTALIAACRAIVASVFGDTVSVPKDLLP